MASGALGGLIATTQIIAALANPARVAEVSDILKGLGIDVAAVSLYAFLYSGESKARMHSWQGSQERKAFQILSSMWLKENYLCERFTRVCSSGNLCWPCILHYGIFQTFTGGLLEQGVLVVSFAIDGNVPSFEFEESEEMIEIPSKRKKLWQLTPVYVFEWSKYLALRLDGCLW